MEASTVSDKEMYHFLAKNKPQGNVYLSVTEQGEFENAYSKDYQEKLKQNDQ